MVYEMVTLLIVGIFIIYKSSEWVIRYSISLSRLLGLSTMVIGFILIAISTSLPEIFVTVLASLSGDVNLGVGNILGSNLFDIAVIIGITTVVVGTIYMKRKETLNLIGLLFITSALTLVIFSFPSLNVMHGIALLILFAFMIVKLARGGRVEKEIYDDGEIPLLPKEKKGLLSFFKRENIPLTVIKFIISVALLLAGTKLLVDASINLANVFSLSSAFIGATIVALGTSLPELSVTLAAVRKKHYALAMGDVVGSAVINMTFVLGILSLISTGPLDIVPITGMLPFLIISTLYLWYALNQKRKITKYDGMVLLLLYAAFLLEQAGILALFR